MAKKVKSKARLDKYYHIAKEQGYRSRASFKLIQLNRKYNFLSSAQCVIDLCAAPGGWLQVAAKYMPVSSIKIGVDLVSIKSVPGCITLQEDITTQKCYAAIKKNIKHFKADVVLNDGAPNVGANWAKDAYTQSELVLYALKLATQFLKKGGTFVTKIFRSGDYNSLMWVFQKFFEKVEATKPQASRATSAEIFVVCQRYIEPDFIDKRLFDVRFVFKDTENEAISSLMSTGINSIEKLFEKRRHRGGYADDAPQSMYREIDIEQFINAENPFPIFMEFNKIKVSEDSKKRYLSLVEPPKGYEGMFEDIKVLGRREVQALIKWRNKVQMKIRSDRKKGKEEANGEANAEGEDGEDGEEEEVEVFDGEENESDFEDIDDEEEYGDEDGEEEDGEEEEEEEEVDGEEKKDGEEENDEEKGEEDFVDQEMTQKIIEGQKKELSQKRKERERTLHKIMKSQQQNKSQELSGMLGTMEFEQELEELDKFGDFENLAYVDPEDENQEEKKTRTFKKNSQAELEENIEYLYETRKRVQSEKIEKQKIKEMEKEEKKLRRQEKLVEIDERFRVRDTEINLKREEAKNLVDAASAEDYIQKSKFFSNDLFNKLKEDGKKESLTQKINENTFINPLKVGKTDAAEQPKKKGNNKKGTSKNMSRFDNSSDEDDDDNEPGQKSSLVGKRQRNGVENGEADDVDEEADDGKYEMPQPVSEMELRRRKLKKDQKRNPKKKTKDQQDEENGDIEYVPRKRFEDYNPDDLALNLALARKMLRKKDRDSLIEDSFNRYAVDSDEDAPLWFKEDEEQHNFKVLPITKEEFQAEKKRINDINNRPVKKVAEAKFRKKRILQGKLRKAKSKAEVILEQEGVSEASKMKEIQRVYKKEINSTKKEKKYLVGKKYQTMRKGKGANNSRYTKSVDARLKKDRRSTKHMEKRSKKIVKENRGTKTKRHQRRRKGK
eukprot:TRINITY_DN363_c0_g1_i3.p1 TRINITY_DN363_c0_g1~~TRINITY_DN363_c0_g1_i3.p1  ORF type:complete len:951 (+),score=305.80 TRINITY_DN363_c0_g1_i3:127-2979(+)